MPSSRSISPSPSAHARRSAPTRAHPSSNWNDVQNGGGALSLDPTFFASPPAGVTLERAEPVDFPELRFLRTIAGPFEHASLQADVLIAAAPTDPGQTLTLLDLVFIKGAVNRHLRLQHSSTKLELVEAHFGYADSGYGYVFNSIGPSPPLGEWRRMRIEVDVVPVPRARVFLGADKLFDDDLREPWEPGSLEIDVGAFANYGRGGAWTIHLDNVAVDAQ